MPHLIRNLSSPQLQGHATTLNSHQPQQATTSTDSTKALFLGLHKERLASHVLGLGQTHGSENCGSDVTQNTLVILQAPALGVVGHDEGNLVGGVAGLGLAIGELHLLSVAVVSGDEEDVALLLASLEDLANGLVGGRATNDGSFVYTSVADHVGGCEVVHDEGEALLAETLHDLVGNTIGRHLRGLVVGRNGLVGGNEILTLVTDLKREDLLDTTVEEEGDVGVLLGLSNVDLLNALLAKPLSQDIVHALGLESNRKGVIALVAGHGHQLGELGVGEVGQDGLVNIAEELGDLSDTVGSVVEEEDGIVVCKSVNRRKKHKCRCETHP